MDAPRTINVPLIYHQVCKLPLYGLLVLEAGFSCIGPVRPSAGGTQGLGGVGGGGIGVGGVGVGEA